MPVVMLNEKTKIVHKVLRSFPENMEDPRINDLPKFGPYRFKDKSAYIG